jgi:hypothetical protein
MVSSCSTKMKKNAIEIRGKTIPTIGTKIAGK